MSVVSTQLVEWDPRRGVSSWWVGVLAGMGLALGGGLWWMAVTQIDIAAMGQGQLVPTDRVQVVQNLEGGILQALMVKEGDRVEKNQNLARFQNVEFLTQLQELRAQQHGYEVERVRLIAEVGGTTPTFPASLAAKHPELVARERQLFISRRLALKATMQAMAEEGSRGQIVQLRAQSNLPLLRGQLSLARQQRAIIQPQVEKGVVSKLDLLAVDQKILELQARVVELTQEARQGGSSGRESVQRQASEEAKFRSEALARLNEIKVKVDALKAQARNLEDRLVRRDLRAPMRGIVKKIHASTIGAVIRPGGEVMELVPVDNERVVEARFAPQDIAFIHPGQQAYVRITAYDASIYGAMPAVVAQVSADATTNQRDETYYLVKVRTLAPLLDEHKAPLPLLPGMVAQVDVLTGKRSILDYLLKPVTKLRYTALRER